jgi:LmbE family N-acetylglucosaminyl deacetylase
MTVKSVLAIGSHPDDVELGCAGALSAHRAMGHSTSMLVMSGGEQSRNYLGNLRQLEQEASAKSLGASLYWGGFVDCGIPDDHTTIDRIEAVMDAVRPDVIYVHAPDDAHQDHRIVAAAAVSAGRRTSRILYYQSPSTTRFEPTVFIDISDHLGAKLSALACHKSQVNAESVQLDAIAASARHWGAFARVVLAEAFVPVRFVWDMGSPRSILDDYIDVHASAEEILQRLTTTG